jgi:uncharacterized Zn finger protein (UPF0148 family)
MYFDTGAKIIYLRWKTAIMKLLVCPVCKSTDVEPDAGGYTGKYYCKKCGYLGSFIMEMSEGELKEIMESQMLEDSEKVEKEKSKDQDFSK